MMATTSEENCWSVYIHESPSGKKYVGITSKDPKKRWLCGHGYRHNAHFTSSIKKYGWKNFTHTVIERNLSYVDACKMEVSLIDKYGTTDRNKGYNISLGGDRTTKGCKRTEAQREKISSAIREKWRDDGYRNRVSNTIKQKRIIPPSRKGCVSEKRKPVFQFSMNGDFIAEYPSIHHAADALGVNAMAISNACNGKTKTSCGYKFSFERNVNLNEEG